jgi:hypothetical protein
LGSIWAFDAGESGVGWVLERHVSGMLDVETKVNVPILECTKRSTGPLIERPC